MDWWAAWESIRQEGEGSPYYEQVAGELKEILGEMPNYNQVVTYASDEAIKANKQPEDITAAAPIKIQRAGLTFPELMQNIGPSLNWLKSLFINPNVNPYGYRGGREGTAAKQLQGGINRMTD